MKHATNIGKFLKDFVTNVVGLPLIVFFLSALALLLLFALFSLF